MTFPPLSSSCLALIRVYALRQLAMWQPSLLLVTIDVIWCIWGGMIDL